MLISFVSAKGSPGVTTAALAIAARWPRLAVVVDADPFGGNVAAGLSRGSWLATAGLMDLVVDTRTMSVEVALRQQVFRPGAHCPYALAGFGRPGQAGEVPWREATDGFETADADVLADCGRFTMTNGVTPLLRRSDVLVLVTPFHAARGPRCGPAGSATSGVGTGQAEHSTILGAGRGARPGVPRRRDRRDLRGIAAG